MTLIVPVAPAPQPAPAAPPGLHAGLIMDGNGRWATARGLPRARGHEAGVKALRRVVEAAPGLGLGTLTVFAFSADNWRRPEPEVMALLGLLGRYLSREVRPLVENGVRLTVIGRRDRLPDGIAARIAAAEAATAGGTALHLRIAFDYSARDAILAAAARAESRDLTRAGFSALLSGGTPDLDLVIRTGGERRLSDFLLWEAAYAELWFTDRLWPDFAPSDLAEAVAWFRGRERRFGGLPGAAPAMAAAATG